MGRLIRRRGLRKDTGKHPLKNAPQLRGKTFVPRPFVSRIPGSGKHLQTYLLYNADIRSRQNIRILL